jgi:hypothetical protein
LGRKGARGQKKYAVVPVMIELIKATRQVACGGLHSAALTGAFEFSAHQLCAHALLLFVLFCCMHDVAPFTV